MFDTRSNPAASGNDRARLPDYIPVAAPQPVVLAYGVGVDSTALLLELESRGTPPDLVSPAIRVSRSPRPMPIRR